MILFVSLGACGVIIFANYFIQLITLDETKNQKEFLMQLIPGYFVVRYFHRSYKHFKGLM